MSRHDVIADPERVDIREAAFAGALSIRYLLALDATGSLPLTCDMSETGPSRDPAGFARQLLRSCDRAALATSLRGAPYASLVLVATDLDASPLLLLSDLAQHSRNIAFEPRISLLFDATRGYPDPLSGPRLTVIGQAEAADDPRLLARFTARHPSASLYAGFADFHLYRVGVERGHLVAGFGRIEWIEASELLFTLDTRALAVAEPAILVEVNEAHADAIAFYARRLLGRADIGWRMTGIDPEGIDLRRPGETARLDFPGLVLTPEAARAALTRLLEEVRR
jgi:heme oxygenase (biliverdin-IX-beta and delta-forming)